MRCKPQVISESHPDRALDYLADSEGTTLNFKVMESTITTFREKGTQSTMLAFGNREDVKSEESVDKRRVEAKHNPFWNYQSPKTCITRL